MTPDLTPDELATLQRIEAAEPAPESYIGSDGLTNDERRKWMPRIGNNKQAEQ